MDLGARLADPHKLVPPARLAQLNQKLSSVMTRMFRLPENGGNPFLFALSAPKPHELVPPEFFGIEKGMTNPDGSPMHGTAATDGKKFYWDADFLELLSLDECPTVMYHESYHMVLFHCDRLHSAEPRVRNWAMDYVVNSCIEHDHEQVRRQGQLWGGNLGKPIHLDELLDHIDGKVEADFEKEPRIFADKKQFGRSPESIYAEIMAHWEKSPRKCPTCAALSFDPKTKKPKKPGPCQGRPACKHGGMCCPTCGCPVNPKSGKGYGDGVPFPMDAHIPAAASKQDVQADTMRAAQQAKTMRGTVPSAVEDALGELMKPTLRFTDIVRSSCMKKVQDAGLKNDWKRFRKRYIAVRPRQFLPKRHTHRPRWLAMIDTSGSMSQDDLVYGISQLQVLGNGTEGFVVPCDAGVHWDGLTPIKSLQDIQRVKIVGRGGTVFDDFFKEFPQKLGLEFDCVVVITDGDCGVVPPELRPPLDVVWVLTRKHKDYKPSFGRVAPLRTDRP